MSWQAHLRVLNLGKRVLTHAEISLLQVIAYYISEEKGYAWPSVKMLARGAGRDERATQKNLANLVAKGYLDINYVPGKPSQYRLLDPVHLEAARAIDALLDEGRLEPPSPKGRLEPPSPPTVRTTAPNPYTHGWNHRPNSRERETIEENDKAAGIPAACVEPSSNVAVGREGEEIGPVILPASELMKKLF